MEVKKQNHKQEFKVDWKKDYNLMTHEEKLELMKLYASYDENRKYGFTDIYEEASEDEDMLDLFLKACNHQDPKAKPISKSWWTALWMAATYD